MPIPREKMTRILETLKSRLGAGQRGGEIPENLQAEPNDIVFFALEERKSQPTMPMPPRPIVQDQPMMPEQIMQPQPQQQPMMQEPQPQQQQPMGPGMQSQPTSPAQPGPGGMDLSSLFDF